jgi:hypothetical protein
MKGSEINSYLLLKQLMNKKARKKLLKLKLNVLKNLITKTLLNLKIISKKINIILLLLNMSKEIISENYYKIKTTTNFVWQTKYKFSMNYFKQFNMLILKILCIGILSQRIYS